MGSLLTGFFKCLFLEILEVGLFKFIIPKDSSYFCHIDILFIYPQNNGKKITDKLNKIEPTIDFIYELETKNT